jgi:hypothetical protein
MSKAIAGGLKGLAGCLVPLFCKTHDHNNNYEIIIRITGKALLPPSLLIDLNCIEFILLV